MLSVVAIVNRNAIPKLLLEFICKTYLFSLVTVGMAGLIYAQMNLGETGAKEIKKRTFIIGGTVCGVLIYLLPISYYQKGRTVYTYGASVVVTYLAAALSILMTLVRLQGCKTDMYIKRVRAIRLWMLIWMVAAAIQAIDNSLLLVGFAAAIGMMILFFEMENPEANMDRETGLFNMHALAEYMKQKSRDGESVAILAVMIENHAQLDLAVPHIVNYLNALPDTKVFKRFDGEYYLLFNDRDKLSFALAHLRERFHVGWRIVGVNQNLILSPLFVVLWDSKLAKSPEELFRLFADCRMENESSEDHEVVYIDEDMFERRREHDQIAREIQVAMDEDRVVVYYQPIYSVEEKHIVSAEALVRILNPDGSLMPPGRFIPVAESTGSIKRLGEIVFEKTCQFIRDKDLGQYGMHYIEINLSVEQCESPDLAQRYIHIMKQYNIDPSWINLEITETGSIKTRRNLLDNMEQLIAYGVQFSLDDFGSGESNLNYIVDMPVKIVKFDRDMTQAYFENERAMFIMYAAGNMIHDMGLKIVSEGVETHEQFLAIEEFGVDYVQGYYFSKPLPQDEFVEFVQNWKYEEAAAS
jgi:EAL domain-containing protein (putative c-di-GMP-specific phosphodiesterase class I)